MPDPDELDLALDALYEEIASLGGDANYHLVLSRAEFDALLAAATLLRDHIAPGTEERQTALDHLCELLIAAQADALSESALEA